MRSDTIEKVIETTSGEEIPVREKQMIRFQEGVEEIAADGLGYIDAVVAYCDQHGIEIETVGSIMSQNLLRKVTEEAKQMNLVKGASSAMRLFA